MAKKKKSDNTVVTSKGESKRIADLLNDKAAFKAARKAASIFHGRLPRRGWGYRFIGVPA